MENNIHKQFSLNYKEIIIDEISLEGLEGIGIDSLWRYVEKRLSAPVTEKMKSRFWNFILHCKDISLYQLPQPVPCVEILDRFSIVDEDTGQILEHSDYLDGPYEYCPVAGEYGSCAHYKTRKLINKEDLKGLSYQEVLSKMGPTIVMVASIEERWRALAPHICRTYITQMTPVQYCILELVGKSRENGQMSLGKSNVLKIVKEPKLLFYYRNSLQKLDLVRTQCITQIVSQRGVKSLLMRLKRFHKPLIQCVPTRGKIHNVCDYLLKQPNYMERTELIVKKGFLNHKEVKKLQKTQNIFNFEERIVTPEDTNQKNKSKKSEVKRKFIILTSPSDESSHSDEETSEELKCQYKVKVNLLRQAYERFFDAGLKGLTQIEIAQLLGIEFYSARTICRLFKSKNIVREFMEDRGKQRIARYIAVNATEEMDGKYEEEKKKFMDYMVESNNMTEQNVSLSPTASDSEVPRKKMKLSEAKDNIDQELTDSKTIEDKVTEVKVIDGLEKSTNITSLLCAKKNPTLRQLRYANGILKVIKEKLAITSYQTLAHYVFKETGEPPMDTKALKIFVQKLVAGGQLKLLKIKWPSPGQNYSILLCAPHVKSTDPIIKSKYNEICARVLNKKTKMKKTAHNLFNTSLFEIAHPKYMKIQKLHEYILKIVYFKENESPMTESPDGFCSLMQIIPEFTVEYAMANMSHMGLSEITENNVINESMYHLKLQDAPKDVFKMFLLSVNLQNSVKINLKSLAMLGLIQLVTDSSQANDGTSVNYVFYVNRHANILDTTGIWPRPDVNRQSLEKSYYFATLQDVKNYWNDVYNISTKTTIDLANRTRKNLLPPVRMPEEVQSYDNGQYIGDGKGPCGFDSSFFLDIPRLWCTFYTKDKKAMLLMKKKAKIRLPKKEKVKKPRAIKKKITSKSSIKAMRYREIDKKEKKIDLSLKWSKTEDRIIMLCKAAITILSPVSQPGSLRLRNSVAKEIISINDSNKTSTSCHRRASMLESNSALAYERECILNEIRRRDFVTKYDDLLKKLRMQFPGSLSKLIFEARLPMMELVWIMSQLTKCKLFNRKVPCVATNVEDFYKNYTLSPSSANRTCSWYKTLEQSNPNLAAIKEGIILAVMLSFQRQLTQETSKKIHDMFSSHTDQSLRMGVEHLRKCGAITTKEKFLSQMNRFSLQEVVQSSYKIAANYQRKWISRLNSDFVTKIIESLDVELSSNLKGSPELNCIFSELQVCNATEMVLETPPVVSSLDSTIQEEHLTVSDVETKYKLKSGICVWKNKMNVKKLSELYQDIEFEETLNILLRPVTISLTTDDLCLNMEPKIISHLKNKKEAGSSLRELQEITKCEVKTLTNNLAELERNNVITRVGYFENLVVLTEFVKPWTMCVNGDHIIPRPWLTLDGGFRNDILLKWAGVIMNRVFENPGCSVYYLFDNSDLLTAKSAQDICVLLEKCKCVTLHVLRTPESDLFSSDDIEPEVEEFNPYESVENIIVYPVKNSLTRYAWLKKRLDEYCKDDL